MINLDFPFHIDGRGRTALADDPKHLRDLIEQVLFTKPRERVNRPDFGTELGKLLFEPNSNEVAAAVRFSIQGALTHWLGDLIEVRAVTTDSSGPILSIEVTFAVRRTGQVRTEPFEQRKPQ
jgi:phage baseplate assembly protein W